MEARPQRRAHIVLNDPDLDITPNPDKASVEVFTEAGAKQTVELTETGNATGIFAGPLTLSTNPQALNNPRILYIRPGDVLWMKYLDQRNMQPGYKTFRHAYVLENRPTAAQLIVPPLLTTAWPFEIKGTGDEDESPIAARSLGQGRISIGVHDPDAMPNGDCAVSMKINALIGGAARDLTLNCTGPCTATEQVDLVLGEAEVARRVGDSAKTRGQSELAVLGDDIVRLSYVDAHVPSGDLQVRRSCPTRYSRDRAKRRRKRRPRMMSRLARRSSR